MTAPLYAVGTPCWFDLVSDDPRRTADFYSGLFQWDIASGHATDVPYLIARVGRRTVAGISSRPAHGPPAGWMIYFACDDVRDVAARTAAAGGAVLVPPAAEGAHGADRADGADGAFLTFRDAAGAIAGAWQPGRVVGAESVGEPASFGHAELRTADVSGASAFYREVFHRSDDAAGAVRVEIRPEPAARSRWIPYVVVCDLSAIIRAAEAAGAVVADSAGAGRAVMHDPLGHEVGLIQRR